MTLLLNIFALLIRFVWLEPRVTSHVKLTPTATIMIIVMIMIKLKKKLALIALASVSAVKHSLIYSKSAL